LVFVQRLCDDAARAGEHWRQLSRLGMERLAAVCANAAQFYGVHLDRLDERQVLDGTERTQLAAGRSRIHLRFSMGQRLCRAMELASWIYAPAQRHIQ